MFKLIEKIRPWFVRLMIQGVQRSGMTENCDLSTDENALPVNIPVRKVVC